MCSLFAYLIEPSQPYLQRYSTVNMFRALLPQAITPFLSIIKHYMSVWPEKIQDNQISKKILNKIIQNNLLKAINETHRYQGQKTNH